MCLVWDRVQSRRALLPPRRGRPLQRGIIRRWKNFRELSHLVDFCQSLEMKYTNPQKMPSGPAYNFMLYCITIMGSLLYQAEKKENY